MIDWLDRKIAPMLASSARPFDSREHLFEIKWDGIRTLAFFGREHFRLQGRKLTDSTKRYPEIVEALRSLPGEAVLDGEIVALDDGKPSFEKVLERELVGSPEKVPLRARQIPVIYMAFDLLYLDGLELLDEPLTTRRRHLSKLLDCRQTGAVLESTFVHEHGKAYYQEAVERGLEGIVAKVLDSPYRPGKRTQHWVKIKAERFLDCVVIGTVVESVTGRVKSLVLGAYRDKTLVWLGNAGSGLDSKTLEGLANELGPLAGEPPDDLDIAIQDEIRWLKPELVVRIKYLEMTREGRFRAPVVVGFVDAPPESCRVPEAR
jgi:DNA ligase D-like protein (predicted ligase)